MPVRLKRGCGSTTHQTQFCVFAGPTQLSKIPRNADIFEPAALGSVFRAVEQGYKTICLIDGVFGNSPSVWHKEILFALKRNVVVCGASSIGALRAAELHSFGMIGFGVVYRAFRGGTLRDDDEVCVAHAVRELDFQPLSEAMVNIRFSLRRMRRSLLIERDSESRILSRLKDVHFASRDLHAIDEAFQMEFGTFGASKFSQYLSKKVDVKALDAKLMLQAASSYTMRCDTSGWKLPITRHFLHQFVIENADLPKLRRWKPRREVGGGGSM